MRKKLIYLSVAVLLLSFGACNNEETPIQEDGVKVEKGKIAFILPGVKKAVTYTEGVGNENGTSSDDVAIYYFDGTNKFVEKFTPSGTATGSGVAYTIDVSGESGEGHFVILQAPSGTVLPTLSKGDLLSALNDAKTADAVGALSSPFVMSNEKAGGNLFVTVADVADQSSAVNVAMKRRVARFDLINLGGVNISKVSINNANKSGVLLDIDGAVAPASNGLTYDILVEGLVNDGKSFYLYPTVLGKSNNTYITISADEKEYNLDISSSVNIEANKLYKINVSKAPVTGEITFNLVVSEWDDGDDIDVEEVVDIEDEAVFAIPTSEDQGVVISDYSVDYTAATEEVVVSVALHFGNNEQPSIDLVPLNGTSVVGIDFEVGDAVSTYASGYDRSLTVSLSETRVPVDFKLVVSDGQDLTKFQEYLFKSVPDYDDNISGSRPVLISGRYWAPVNVGATSLIEGGTTDAKAEALSGKYYQWGRNIGFAYAGTVATLVGPKTAEEELVNQDKYIVNGSGTKDWLSPSDNTLWSGEKAQGPCPDGWVVPTATQFSALYATAARTFANGILKLVDNVSNEIIYLPAAGVRNNDTGAVGSQGTHGLYWSSTATEGAASPASYLIFTSASPTVPAAGVRAAGCPVRCVQK